RIARTVGNGPNQVELGDINGDGKLDIATVDTMDTTVSVILGNGDGNFQSRITTDLTVGAQSLALGDLNGDAKLDLVTAASGISSLLGNGNGTFRARSLNIPAGTYLAIRDLDGDGAPDIVTPQFSADANFIFFQDTITTTSTTPIIPYLTGLDVSTAGGA